MSGVDSLIEGRLLRIVDEMAGQINEPALAPYYPAGRLPLAEELSQMREYVNCGENGLAYESIVANLESCPFTLSGGAAVSLLELGLIMQYKTDRDEDATFDHRPS
jgi:hypothetical protein